jgi:hypothetical protein
MNQSIFAFVFPFDSGAEFRCKRNFLNAESAANWALEIMLLNKDAREFQKEGDDVCYFKEVESSEHVFEPALESHSVVCWRNDSATWEAYDVID